MKALHLSLFVSIVLTSIQTHDILAAKFLSKDKIKLENEWSSRFDGHPIVVGLCKALKINKDYSQFNWNLLLPTEKQKKMLSLPKRKVKTLEEQGLEYSSDVLVNITETDVNKRIAAENLRKKIEKNASEIKDQTTAMRLLMKFLKKLEPPLLTVESILYNAEAIPKLLQTIKATHPINFATARAVFECFSKLVDEHKLDIVPLSTQFSGILLQGYLKNGGPTGAHKNMVSDIIELGKKKEKNIWKLLAYNAYTDEPNQVEYSISQGPCLYPSTTETTWVPSNLISKDQLSHCPKLPGAGVESLLYTQQPVDMSNVKQTATEHPSSSLLPGEQRENVQKVQVQVSNRKLPQLPNPPPVLPGASLSSSQSGYIGSPVNMENPTSSPPLVPPHASPSSFQSGHTGSPVNMENPTSSLLPVPPREPLYSFQSGYTGSPVNMENPTSKPLSASPHESLSSSQSGHIGSPVNMANTTSSPPPVPPRAPLSSSQSGHTWSPVNMANPTSSPLPEPPRAPLSSSQDLVCVMARYMGRFHEDLLTNPDFEIVRAILREFEYLSSNALPNKPLWVQQDMLNLLCILDNFLHSSCYRNPQYGNYITYNGKLAYAGMNSVYQKLYNSRH